MASGSFNKGSGWSLLVNQWSHHYGYAYDVWANAPGWPERGGAYYSYAPGTGGPFVAGHQTDWIWGLPTNFLPAGEGLSSLSWYCPNSNDGHGISNATYIQQANGTVLAGGVGAQGATWNPGQLLSQASLNSIGIRLRLSTWHGGVFNTYARTGAEWTCTWTSAPFPTTSVVTGAATLVTTTSARLNGTLDTDGYPINYYFQWGTTISYGNTTPVMSGGSPVNPTAVSADISNLTPGVQYHYRLVGVNTASGVTVFGNDMVVRANHAGSGMII